ncbi:MULTISPECIES: copper resistance protein CopQ [unclassified Cupriavidus]|uniref:copper resistance protein CopQ n=1 Tax=unclassified Cupriavidus TaxID=2640874 RepID=UPI0028B4551F|nr:copper resistance protein CopQ [Cupriavidus sp. SZY C1]MDT6963608.1 copper resistance protein CopQ [Cupriavidus sp. SZY C1]
MTAKTILSAAALAAAFVTGAVQAAPAVQKAGEVYGYSFRVQDARSSFTDGARQGQFDTFSEGARVGKADPFTDGAKVGKADPYTDGARIVAGLDRVGVSASPARSADPYYDGARSVNQPRNPFYDGARTRDIYTDGANA